MQAATPILQAVNRRCEETVNLTLSGCDVVITLRFPSHHAVSVDLRVGSLMPAYRTSPGRALLAFLPPDERVRIVGTKRLKARTPFMITNPARIMAILAEVRVKGVCLNDQEAFIGDISVAAPVLDRNGNPVAAMNIAVPSPRWHVAKVQAELMPIVVAAARKISRALRHDPKR